MRKLEIGSGNRPMEGYEHLDINPNCPCVEYVAPMDKVPAKDNTFDEVIATHVIEHQSWRDGKKLLTEWLRVLKPGGSVSVTTPNLRYIAEEYIKARNGEGEWRDDYNIMHPDEKAHLGLEGQPSPALWANFKLFSSTGEYDIHYACYDAETLSALFREAGATRVEVIHDTSSLGVKGYK